MPKSKILVVDDEEDILELVRYNLAKEGYDITCVISGEEAITRAKSDPPDLILLDLMLPGVDGFEVCQRLKRDDETARVPIVMLTAKGEDSDIVAGLELGADDYITKPFSPKVLTARIRAILRRRKKSEPDNGDVIKVGDLVVNPMRHEVRIGGESLNLTVTEFGLLHFLIRRPGWVFSRNQIIGAVKGEDYAVTERSVDVQITGLRKKLGEYGKFIETVRGVGYRFKD
jgi:two-component system phosphate regulon response regulator PhoB